VYYLAQLLVLGLVMTRFHSSTLKKNGGVSMNRIQKLKEGKYEADKWWNEMKSTIKAKQHIEQQKKWRKIA